MKHERIETRSAVPPETRNTDNNPLAAATQAAEEMRSAFDERMTSLDDITERLDALDTRENRPGSPCDAEGPDLEQRVFCLPEGRT